MIALHINIDHVATVRQARQISEPDPVTAAGLVELAGLELPFKDGCLKSVVDQVTKWLDEVDVAAL